MFNWNCSYYSDNTECKIPDETNELNLFKSRGSSKVIFPMALENSVSKIFFFVFWSTILSRAQECVHFLVEQFTEEEEGWWAEIVLNTQLTIYRTQKHLKEYKQCQTAQGRKVKSV